MKTQQTENLGCLKDGIEFFVADSRGNKLSKSFSTAQDVYDEIKSLINHEKPDEPAPAQAPICPCLHSPAQAQHSHTMDCLSKGDASACPVCKPINDAAIERALEQMRHNIVPRISVCIIAEAYDELQAHAQQLADTLKETIDALYNETTGKDDSPWISSVKTKSCETLNDWEQSQ